MTKLPRLGDEPLRVLVCGSRNWGDLAEIKSLLFPLFGREDVLIIHGGAWGADKCAGTAAQHLGLEVKVYEADWDRHGRSAGPLRNSQMLEEGKPHVVLAFTEDIDASRGTADTVRKANKKGIPTFVYPDIPDDWSVGR